MMNLLQVSFYGAVFIIAVTIIRAVAIHRLPKKTFLILWEMVLLRLLTPFSIPSAFSVYTLIDHPVSAPVFLNPKTDLTIPMISQESLSMMRGANLLPADTLSFISVRSVIWSAGMIALAVFFIISYLRCRMEFQTAFPVRNDFVAQWLKECSLKRRITVKQSDRISTPLTYGLFHPVILMPKKTDWENAAQLQFIFSHESMHIRRFDAFTKWVAALVLCMHWFNPLVWIMYTLFNRDLELSCDESVIRQFGEKSKSAYSRMLIGMEAEKSGLSPFCSNFSKNAIEERITAIMRTKRTTPVTLISACLTVFVTICMFATSADAKNAMSITHESVDILHYEDGYPYIHDVLTNNTDKTIVETEYCMLAYDENGSPLKLYWNFLDSSAESSYEHLVRTETMILPRQTEDYRGGWSLYDGDLMSDLPIVGNGEANQVTYSLFCLKQVVFEDGTIWNNPGYEDWFKAYAGKETDIDRLADYYPYQYALE